MVVSEEVEIKNGFGFKTSADDKKLLAIYAPCEDKLDLTVNIFKERFTESPFAKLFLNEHLVVEFLHRYKNASNESFEFEVGERRDASCNVAISMDKMKAFFSLIASFGGKEITLADVQKVLAEKRVTWGVVPNEVIEGVLAKGHVSEFLIAEGLEPVAGTDSEFESLVGEVRERKPLIDEHGNVDYRELGDIVVVHKNDVLMKRIPPVPGKKGCNVLGVVINPKGGTNLPFSADKRGVHLNPENNDQLLADMTGQAVHVQNGMVVLPVLTLKQVDFASGNIRFDGSVVVKGDVKEGMKIYALEDITIEGSVTDAVIECMGSLNIKGGVTGNSKLIANGDINIKGGVQGYQEITETAVDDIDHVSKIVTRGSVIVGFAENFNIEAGIDIIVEKYAMNNHLMAENAVITGAKNSGKKSSIMGGVTWAMILVKGTIIGASSGIKTYIQVGLNPHVQKREIALKNLLVLNEKEQEDIHKILAFIDEHPEKRNDEMLEKLHHTLSKLIIDAEMYNSELDELMENMTVIADAKVIAERSVYIGTEISINSVYWKAQENRGKSLFRVKDGEMVINTR
jgi:uncharacterized protein (DUF342 family)